LDKKIEENGKKEKKKIERKRKVKVKVKEIRLYLCPKK